MVVLLFSCHFDEKMSYPEGMIEERNQDRDNDGYTNIEDCDDENPNIFPNQIEVCDGIDNNCNNQIDEGVQLEFFEDHDDDGFGSGEEQLVCEQQLGMVNNNLDCDDENPEIFPFAVEICDEVDNDCDDEIDEEVQIIAYPDQDGDGFGDENTPISICQFNEQFLSDSSDCDDNNSETYPNATEYCDEIDNNCNNQIDEDVQNSYHQDFDNDGYGNPSVELLACFLPHGFVENTEDCNDENALIHPESIEVCDEIDNNCDGNIDIFNVYDGEIFYADEDDDGYGHADNIITACTLPLGYSQFSDDCDDNQVDIHPDAQEYCDDIDNDCDGQIDESDSVDATYFYIDQDGDGFGSMQVISCFFESHYSVLAGDCNDQDPNRNPTSDEYCDGVDNNCNNQIDESTAVDALLLYTDSDGDGFGNPIGFYSCFIEDGVLETGDCDDSNIEISPNADEICDEIDNDCNMLTDDAPTNAFVLHEDSDGDGFGNPDISIQSCDVLLGWVSNDLDCDDVQEEIHSGALEQCSGLDLNCDGILPLPCSSCQEIHQQHPEYENGIYTIFEVLLGSQDVYCDMEIEGGGWTLVQRTLWDWNKTQDLMTDYDTWYFESINTPETDSSWRLAGQFWSLALVDGEHMFKHVARDLTGIDCEPLYYSEDGIVMNINSETTTLQNASDLFAYGTELMTTDDDSTCITNDLGVPFFYTLCCPACPSYQGDYWIDNPHPMAEYLDVTMDLYGNTTSEVCPSGSSLTSNFFEGVNQMEYYLR